MFATLKCGKNATTRILCLNVFQLKYMEFKFHVVISYMNILEIMSTFVKKISRKLTFALGVHSILGIRPAPLKVPTLLSLKLLLYFFHLAKIAFP